VDKHEILTTIQVDPEKIRCRDCVFRNGGMKFPHFTKAHCEIYVEPELKPMKILFEGADCDFYVQEK